MEAAPPVPHLLQRAPLLHQRCRRHVQPKKMSLAGRADRVAFGRPAYLPDRGAALLPSNWARAINGRGQSTPSTALPLVRTPPPPHPTILGLLAFRQRAHLTAIETLGADTSGDGGQLGLGVSTSNPISPHSSPAPHLSHYPYTHCPIPDPHMCPWEIAQKPSREAVLLTLAIAVIYCHSLQNGRGQSPYRRNLSSTFLRGL